MRSLSKIVKASKVILDNKKFRLSPEIIKPLVLEHVHREGESEELVSEDQHGDVKHDHESFLERMRRESEEIMDTAAEEARKRVEEAQREHERIVLEAYENAREIMEKSREEGYKAGFETGYTEGMDSAQSEIDQARNFKEEAVLRYKEMFTTAEPEMVQIILSAVERILAKKMDEDVDYLEGLVKSAIEKCTYTESIALRVSPDDFMYALGLRDRIVTMFERIDQIDIRKDPSMEKGSVVVDTASGSVDSSIATQFEQLKNTFEDLLKSE